jgi:hypothetical protein
MAGYNMSALSYSISFLSIFLISTIYFAAPHTSKENLTPRNSSSESPPADENYMAPILLTNVSQEIDVTTEETFGFFLLLSEIQG